ncbi:MAG: hypothetical protein KF791_13985 [Verrucomicrobiae bacterium]|nr:hypothetical protein [Verrucomicrobiae bacterium]
MIGVSSATTSDREIRKFAVERHRKDSEAPGAPGIHPLRAAKRLALDGSGRTLISEDEADIAAFSDAMMFLP